jgi:hypothetical protein
MTVAETIHEIRRKSVKVISKLASPCFRGGGSLDFRAYWTEPPRP